MKKILLSLLTCLLAVATFAQQKIAFPFQGGKDAMTEFFRDSTQVSPDVIKKKATGVVVFKFSADNQGQIKKLVIYYADDATLVTPAAEAIRKSAKKWIVSDKQKERDFLLPVYFKYNMPDGGENAKLVRAAFLNVRDKAPIFPNTQIPLDYVTLLPSVTVSYDIVL